MFQCLAVLLRIKKLAAIVNELNGSKIMIKRFVRLVEIKLVFQYTLFP